MSETHKKKTTNQRRRKAAKAIGQNGRPSRSSKVWRIFHFRERFEPPELRSRCRQRGLVYIREPVNSTASDEAAAYQLQLKLLGAETGLDFWTAYGLYLQLVHLAAQWSAPYRGGLWFRPGEALSDSQLAKLLNADVGQLAKYLKVFSRVGLLEFVSITDFSLGRKRPDDQSPIMKSKDGS